MIENLATALRLLLVTDDALVAGRDIVALCQAAVRGGVTSVQLRLKHASDSELLAHARALVAALPVPVFVNDRLDIALSAGAAGVHLGPDDLSPALARGIVPAGFIIGASVGNAGEVARGAAADYWGIGPLRHTPTKADAGEGLGWASAEALLAAAAGRPCVIIGAVLPEDVAMAHEKKFAGVAIASGILNGRELESATAYVVARQQICGSRA
jgi:thiamine-phosphate pyrophosphorylase